MSRLQKETSTQPEPSSKPRRGQCRECMAIVRAVRAPIRPNTADVVWNCKQAKKNTKCMACQTIVGILKASAGHLPDTNGTLNFDPQMGAWYISVLITTDEGYWRHVTHYFLHAGREPKPDRGIGRLVGKHPIEKNLLRTWLHQCDECHAGRCHSILDPWGNIEKTPPLLLIDVEKMCLVRPCQIPGDAHYVALSYVWGPYTSPFQTLRNNLAQLSTHGALDTSAVASRLPRTIKDSMILVRALGIRYLWCDRLCVVQDDAETKPQQLYIMASIYYNAHFTIAACEGDAEFGLAGISDESPRVQPFRTFRLSDSCTMIQKVPTLSKRPLFEGYHSRGCK